MKWAHLHLALNHVPVLGTFFLLVLFVIGMIRRREEIKRLSLWGFFILAIFSLGLKYTGELALNALKDVSWIDVSIAQKHGDAAGRAVIGTVLLGIMAAGDLFLSKKVRATVPWLNGIILVTAVATFILMVITANLGGDIRHTEIRAPISRDAGR